MKIGRRTGNRHRRSLAYFEYLERRDLLTVFVVNTTSDLGDATPLGDRLVDIDLSTPQTEVSLRAAIEEANASDGPDTIQFAIPMSDPGYVDIDRMLLDAFADTEPDIAIIQLRRALPPILDSDTTIDGMTQSLNIGDTNPEGNEIVLLGASYGSFHEVSLLEYGDAIGNINFGNHPETSLVQGTVWLDLDANSVRNGEAAIPGRVIYLDLNGNGLPDENEPNTLSDNGGVYQFFGAPAGSYAVRQVLPDHWVATFPGSDAAGDSHTLDIDDTSILTNIDFGSHPLRSQITGSVWNDSNGNGIWDQDVIEGIHEDPLPGVSVFMDENENGFFDAGERIVQSDSVGSYAFDNLPPGNYRIGTGFSSGLSQTWPSPEASFYLVSVAAGQTVTDIHFGMMQESVPTEVYFEGTVFADLNFDGVQGVNEPGLSIPLTFNQTTIQSSTNGFYFYSDAPGLYTVQANLPDDWTVLEPQGGSFQVNVDTGNTIVQNFAIQLPAGIVTGTVFVDRDGDAVLTTSEPRVRQAIVYLDLNDNGIQDADEPRTQTDFRGRYALPTPDFGQFAVRTESRTGYDRTGTLDHVVTVSPESPWATNDIGFQPRPVLVQGYVWFDENNDSVRDAAEQILDDVVVGTTNADGSFTVAEYLPDGRYQIEVQVDFPTQLTLTTASKPWMASATVDVAPGAVLDHDIAASPVAPRVHGVKWLDVNADGLPSDELGLAGWFVYADLNRNGRFDDEAEPYTTTGVTGAYSLPLPGPGNYRIAEVPQDNWTQTFPDTGNDGLVIRSDRNLIQGLAIRGSAGNGVRVLGGSGNLIRWNEIYDNGGSGIVIENTQQKTAEENEIVQVSVFGNGGLGIDLGNQGIDEIDPRDEDFGANTGQNRPELGQVLLGSTVSIDGELFSVPNTSFRIDVYRNDPGEHAPQGQVHVGSFSVVTDDQGIAGFRETLDATGISDDSIFTATATDPNGNTSEFSSGIGAELLSTIDGSILEDLHGDGFSSDDVPLPARVIQLWRDNGDGQFSVEDELVQSTISDDAGRYQLEVQDGTFFVVQEPHDDYLQTDGGNFGLDYYTVDTQLGQDFLEVDFANVRLASIAGQLWSDEDRDGVRDADQEFGLSHWTVSLLDESGVVVQSVLTDEMGNYRFRGILPGNYQVVQSRLSGWEPTFPTRRFDTAAPLAGGTISGFATVGNLTTNARPEVLVLNDLEDTVQRSGSIWVYEDLDFDHLAGCLGFELELNCEPIARRLDLAGATRPQSVVLSDFDHDGDTDLAVAAMGLPDTPDTNGVVVLLNQGNGNFVESERWLGGYEPLTLSTIDYNRDDIADFVVADLRANQLVFLQGQGDGTFTESHRVATAPSPTDVTVGDFNGDGRDDVAVVSFASQSLSVLFGNGLSPLGFYAASPIVVGFRGPISATAADINNDGSLDFIVADYLANAISVHRGQGDGTFAAPEHFPVTEGPQAIAVADLNADNHLDIAVASSGSSLLSVLYGDGFGDFADAFSFSVPASNQLAGISPQSVVASDLNADESADLVVGLFVGGAAYLLNREPAYSIAIDYGLDAPNLDFGNTRLFDTLIGDGETSNSEPGDRRDVDGDGFVSPRDALWIVRHLNTTDGEYWDAADVNDDGFVSPVDVLLVVHRLNEQADELRQQAAVAAAIRALFEDREDSDDEQETESDLSRRLAAWR